MFEFFGLTASEDDSPKAEWRIWLIQGAALAIIVFLLKWAFGSFIPFGYFEFWDVKGEWTQWLLDSWVVFAWGIGASLLFAISTRNSYEQNQHAERYLANGMSASLRAGLMEEIIFRWLLLMTSIFGIKVADWILGGFFFDHGFVWWFQTHIFMPVSNWLSFGMLREWMQDPNAWFVAAAVIAANVRFRDGHKYQGLPGMINSWFIGLFFFHLMFKYGLPAVILVHVLYDVFVFGIRGVDRLIERWQDNRRREKESGDKTE